MDKVTGEARIALMGKKDLTNDIIENIISMIPKDKDRKSPVADLFKMNMGKDNIKHLLFQNKYKPVDLRVFENIIKTRLAIQHIDIHHLKHIEKVDPIFAHINGKFMYHVSERICERRFR